MKTLNKFSIIIGLSFVLTGFANAGNRHSFIDTANVIKSKPIYETVKVAIPQKNCRNKRHGHRSKHNHYDNLTDRFIIGGIFIGTGTDASRSRHHPHSKRSGKASCNTVMRYESHQEIVAYRVKYHYKGQKFWTRTPYKPGSTIRIKVSIKPVVEHDYSANVGYDRGKHNG